jgi:hypothetical protein
MPTVKASKSVAKPASKVVAKPTAKPLTKAAKPSVKLAAKPVAKSVTQPAAKPSAAAPTKKTTALKAALVVPKVKIVRDSFTMTEADHELIKRCKRMAVAKGRETRKSEVVRAAVLAFSTWPIDQQLAAYGKLTAVKTGRPRKAK